LREREHEPRHPRGAEKWHGVVQPDVQYHKWIFCHDVLQHAKEEPQSQEDSDAGDCPRQTPRIMWVKAAPQESRGARESIAEVKNNGPSSHHRANGSDNRCYAFPESALVLQKKKDDKNQHRREDDQSHEQKRIKNECWEH